MLNTIIRNLISNAIKFTSIGGEIEISVVTDNSTVNLSLPINSIAFYVKDNGVGMTQEIINKLFKIDETIVSEGTSGEKGTGLGLILCKEFLEKNGGKIWVEGEFDKGSTFYFMIPRI